MPPLVHVLPPSVSSPETDFAIFKRKWHAALAPGRTLPPYEEVALGSLGRLADHLVLVGGSPGAFRILRAGRVVRAWLGSDSENVDALSPDCSGPLIEVLMRAIDLVAPATGRAHRVRDGMVETHELLALPMACRWGGQLTAVCVREQAERYNLVGTIFRSTNNGILALATVRDVGGTPVDMRIVATNAGACRLLRVAEQDLLWRRLSELAAICPTTDLRDRLLECRDAGGKFELSVPFGDGELHLNVSVATAGDLLSATLTDIGEVKRREASFRLLFEHNPVPMWVYDPDTLAILGVNDAAIDHYGYTRTQFLGMRLLDLWPADEREVHEADARTVGPSYQSDRSWRHVRRDGSEIEILSYARRLTFGERPAVLVAIVDVTERKQAEARIAYMAHHDALTGLPNRVLFHQRLDEALVRVAPDGDSLAVLCLDLDHFKSVNDTLGHPIGDLLLRQVAERLGKCLRKSDMVARLGGDEFAIVQTPLPEPEEASRLARRLIETVSLPFDLDGHEAVVGASIGIALAPDDGEDSDALLRNADMALYRAKSEGRGTSHFFEPEMDRRLQARRLLEIDLRKAYAQSEFELFYQPLVNLKSGRVSGFEALIRWRHPERGLVSPAEFIPVAEEIGLIVPIGEWVLHEACREAATWPGDIHVAVNLSPVQFRSRGIVQAVLSALGCSGLAPRRLELEITESVLLGETDLNIATLHQLRSLGVRIAMDDFGTGYSSLSYLRTFPFDKIKIDRSFVREMVERPDCVAIVRAVAGLGASLGIATTAEGVETVEQLERVRAEGCTEVQGYLFSAPRPASELAALLPLEAATSAA
jgi:diguanylate cyclase (GGDEF)-like protein/PAS domain S-box-containing protein